ncbi:hypothetical protein PM082_014107 [Marasmius tenuissimus]|nr:hypothetical protein PM082_014107 [Marasmius tenuissimus]
MPRPTSSDLPALNAASPREDSSNTTSAFAMNDNGGDQGGFAMAYYLGALETPIALDENTGPDGT